jgi:hypothetical protein
MSDFGDLHSLIVPNYDFGSMKPMTHHIGGCHCGKVRYEVAIDLTTPVIECNCSYCEKKGTLLSFVPRAALTITSGEDALTHYHFNTGTIDHSFCKVCGVQCFGEAEGPNGPTAAINVRTIDGIDLAKLTRMPFDGRGK